MNLSRFFASSGLIAPLALPASLAAQASSGAQIFTAIDNSFPGGAGIAGFGLTLGNGGIGARGSFGVALSNMNSANSSASPALPPRWTGHADIVAAQTL